MSTFRLLLADPDLRAMLARERVFQHREDCQILSAGDGDELVRLAGQVRPQMIICDGDLLAASLEPTIAQVRRTASLRTTPLVVTAARKGEMEARLKGTGVDAVLAKPVSKGRFYALLKLTGPEAGLDVRVPVGVEVPYTVGALGRKGRIANLSKGGLFLGAEPLSPVGSRLAIELALPAFTDVTWVNGAVRWVNESGSPRAPELPTGMGVQFVDTAPAALKAVAMYVMLAKQILRVT